MVYKLEDRCPFWFSNCSIQSLRWRIVHLEELVYQVGENNGSWNPNKWHIWLILSCLWKSHEAFTTIQIAIQQNDFYFLGMSVKVFVIFIILQPSKMINNDCSMVTWLGFPSYLRPTNIIWRTSYLVNVLIHGDNPFAFEFFEFDWFYYIGCCFLLKIRQLKWLLEN